MPLPIYVSRNGALVLPAQASISVFNPAIYGAYGVYESLQVVRRIPFALAAHLQRMAHSAAVLELPLPASLPVFERWIADVLQANGVSDCVLRIFVVGADNGGASTAFIWPQPPAVYAAEMYQDGVRVITFEGERYLPQAKSLNALASHLARRRAVAQGAHEALLYHHGFLTEGTNSNLFVVQAGQVLTPPAEQVLSGVTRDLLIALANLHGLPIQEASLALTDRGCWSECFITSTSRHVMPVTAVDDRPVGDGRVGALTSRLAILFEDHFQQQIGRNHR